MIEASHVTKNPQRECITLDRTHIGVSGDAKAAAHKRGTRPLADHSIFTTTCAIAA